MRKKTLIRTSGIFCMLLISNFVSATDAGSDNTESKSEIIADNELLVNPGEYQTDSSEISPEQTSSVVKSPTKDKLHDNSNVNYIITFRAAHERKNKHFMGAKNSSAIVVNPLITVGDFTLDTDFYYGHQFKFLNNLQGAKHFSNLISADKHQAFFKDFNDEKNKKFSDELKKTGRDNVEKAHFYRNYSRMMYEDKANNYRVVVGDTQVRNTIGFQNQFSGAGISIFRQGGNGNTINSGLPLVITRVSKVECKFGGETVGCFILPPGQYSIDDLPPEAHMEGVHLEISDQTGRKEKIYMTYFSGYDHLKEGEDDFDFTIAFRHKWLIEDPHHIRYFSRPRLNTNYRFGFTDDITLAFGAQAVSRAVILDGNVIFNTPYGKISPNVGISHVNYSEYERINHNKSAASDPDYSIDKSKRTALGAGIFYALPQNSVGLHWETFVGIKGKGFGDLRIGFENQKLNNEFIDKHFPTPDRNDEFNGKAYYKNSMSEETSKQLTSRFYTDPIMGFTPSFVFSGNWSNSEKFRQFTVGLTKTFLGCAFTISWGITYDAPHGGRNGSPKDRRIMLSCCVPLNKEFEVSATYSTYADDKKVAYGSVTYTPEAVKGLEICAERVKGIAYDNPIFSIKYANENFDIKAESNISNTKRHSADYKHSTQQRLYIGTSITNNGLKENKSGGFNIIRTATPQKKGSSSGEEEKEYFLDELEKLDNKKDDAPEKD